MASGTAVEAAAPTRTNRLYPSIPAVVFAIWAVVVAFVFPQRLLNADSDLIRHIRHGEYILQHHALIERDPFSFTRGGDPFVAFEYGSQVILALVHRVGGLAANMLFAAVLIATTYALLTRFLLSRNTDPLLTYLVSIVAAVLGAMHWLPRPHLFTLALVVVLLHLLEPVRRPPLWVFFPLFVLWTNLHGGFVYGLVLVGIYLAGTLAEALADPARREEWLGWARYYGGALALGCVATFVTPVGLALHRHIFWHLTESDVTGATQEFWSPDFHEGGARMFLLVVVVIIALFARTTRRPTFPRLFLVVANLAFALLARRNIPLFAATALPMLALHFDPLWRRMPDWRGIRAVFERDARRGTAWPLVLPIALLFAALALARGRVAGMQLVPDQMSRQDYPVEAVRWARERNIQGRIFHEFLWGGYLVYAWPEQRVFVDGGTDFYGWEITSDYLETSGLAPGWRDTLRRWDITLLLMPPGAPISQELAHDGWRVRYCDRTAVLLQRGEGPSTVPEIDRCAKR
ncbi:MAG TPA: hypothetical protein VEB59_05315 [Gemmatimonadales bacterium]|nr:hypothetical protein [Gemmatimonadales bacterium]